MAFEKRIPPTRWQRFAGLFYERKDDCCRRRHWWLAHAWYDVAARRRVMVMWPFNYLVTGAYRINYAWARATHRESWIDRRLLAIGMDREKELAAALELINTMDIVWGSGKTYPWHLRVEVQRFIMSGDSVRKAHQ